MKGEIMIGDGLCPECGKTEWIITGTYVQWEDGEERWYCRCHTVDPRNLDSYVMRHEYASENIKEFHKLPRKRIPPKLNEYTDRGAWHFIPGVKELDILRKYAYDNENVREVTELKHGVQGCPQCKEGRLVMVQEGAGMGTGISLRCKWGVEDCDYELDITDYDMW